MEEKESRANRQAEVTPQPAFNNLVQEEQEDHK